MRKSSDGLGNGLFSAKIRGSTWPWGLMIGRSLIDSYKVRAIDLTDGEGSKKRSLLRIKEFDDFFMIEIEFDEFPGFRIRIQKIDFIATQSMSSNAWFSPPIAHMKE